MYILRKMDNPMELMSAFGCFVLRFFLPRKLRSEVVFHWRQLSDAMFEGMTRARLPIYMWHSVHSYFRRFFFSSIEANPLTFYAQQY